MRKLIVLLLLALTGCSFFGARHRHYRSNLVDYLFPDGMPSHPRAARLQLPLKVGLAFVPGEPRPLDPQSEELRRKSDEGLRLAMLDLTRNLDTEVGSFKASVASGQRADVDIVTRTGQSIRAGGAIDPVSVVLLLIVVAAAFVPMRRTR